MQAPKLPSFFKVPNAKYFSFKPRYYNENKKRREQLLKEEKSPLCTKKHLNYTRKTSECAEFHLTFVRISSNKVGKTTFLPLKRAVKAV